MEIKYELGLRTRIAYEAGDKDELRSLAENEYVKVKRLIGIFARAFEKQWFYDNKPHGFDIQDQRMGALIYRADSCRRRILDYVNGKIDRIEELDEVLLVSGAPEESVSIKCLPLSSTVNLPFHRVVVAPF
jgi:hypothetical protein